MEHKLIEAHGMVYIDIGYVSRYKTLPNGELVLSFELQKVNINLEPWKVVE